MKWKDFLIDYFVKGERKMSLHIDENNILYRYDYYSYSEKSDEISKKVYQTFKKDYSFYYSEIRDEFVKCFCDFDWKREDWEHTCITIFPSHEAEHYSTTMERFAGDICNIFGALNYSGLLERYITHEKSTYGGERSVFSHTSTIKLRTKVDFSKMSSVIVLDDITTSGSSLLAAKEILRKTHIDPKYINLIAIAKTKHDY